MHAQMDAIVETIDANQATINAKGVGFKAFIPAVFARLVNESFESHARNEAASQSHGARTTREEPQSSAGPVGKRRDPRQIAAGGLAARDKPTRLKSIQKDDQRIG